MLCFLLANNGYSRVPVITKEKKYVGTISIADIMSYQAKNQLTDWELAQTDIGKMVNTKMETISENVKFDGYYASFGRLSIFTCFRLKMTSFWALFTRKSILKAVNSLLHVFH